MMIEANLKVRIKSIVAYSLLIMQDRLVIAKDVLLHKNPINKN